MWKKTIYLLVILSAFYTSVIINYPSAVLKSTLGYNWMLDFYAGQVSGSTVDIIYNPGIRNINVPLRDINVRAIVPGNNSGYEEKLDEILKDDCSAIIECSAFDTWHTTISGQEYLTKIRDQAYRVVVFDGGHHLPTLGLAPDIIIIPRFKGYAVHTYMLDGIKVSKIMELAKKAGTPAIIAAAPRWALVKNERCLETLTEKVLYSIKSQRNFPEQHFSPVAAMRISKYGGCIFAYINDEYADDSSYFIKQVRSLGMTDVKQIYLAFNFNDIIPAKAELFSTTVSEKLKIPVEIVNEPVKVTNVFWSEK